MNVKSRSFNGLLSAVIAAGCCMFFGTALAKPDYATLISHRGESFDAPENTLPAFQTAVDRGFGFECDVYLSKDGRVFTFHDRNLRRTTGGADSRKCADVTWDEISRLDVGNWGKWKGSKFAGTRPALLEEVLELARDGRWIFVEIKTGPEIVPFVKKIFAKQKKATPKNVLFIAFNNETCKELNRLMPEYKTYWLTGSVARDKKPVTAEYILKNVREVGAEGVDCHFNAKIVTADLVKAVKAAGYEFHVWTVDDLHGMQTAFKRGVQTVTTNCAKKLLDGHNKGKAAK